MFDVGGGELILIVLAILLLFGPKKLPEVAQMVGKGMQKVKQAQSQFQSQINEIQRDINTSVNIDNIIIEKPKPAGNIVESKHRIGAYDQLDLDKNFVAEYIPPNSSSESETPANPDSGKSNPVPDTNIEKTTTKKQQE